MVYKRFLSRYDVKSDDNIILHLPGHDSNFKIKNITTKGLAFIHTKKLYKRWATIRNAEIIINNKDKRDMITLGSELGYGGAGHLSLVKVAWAMKMTGMAKEEIEKVTWDNPKKFFNLPVK